MWEAKSLGVAIQRQVHPTELHRGELIVRSFVQSRLKETARFLNLLVCAGRIAGQNMNRRACRKSPLVFVRIGCLGFTSLQSAREVALDDVKIEHHPAIPDRAEIEQPPIRSKGGQDLL